MRILLTGATGFLGKNLIQHLPKHLGEEYTISGIGSQNYDLRNYHACRKALEYYNPDVIVHAAGSVGGIGANRENPGKFMYENLIMGTNLIEEARNQMISKFVLLGTVCSYPKYTPTPFLESYLWEGYPEETNAPYGIAKKTLMRLLQAYGEQYGMRGANLIPVNMYGPHDHFNLTSSHVIPALILKVYTAMKNGEQEINLWGTGQASREFLYAPDCAEAIALAIKKDVSLDPINIGTGSEIKIIDLLTEICDQMGYTGGITFDDSKPDGQPRRCLNTWSAEDKLGFKAKTDLYTGLKQTIEWFLNDNNWKGKHMNLGFYVDSQQQSETVNKIYNTLNSLVDSNGVENASLFYNDIDFNPITPKFGCFNATDVWYFTGNLVIASIKNALSLGKVVNKFKPFFLYDSEKNSALELVAISNQMPIIAQTQEDADYIRRVTGSEAKLLDGGDLESVLGVINE